MKKHTIAPESRGERGQSIVLIALALAALIGFMGLVLDGGDMYFNRRDSQNASDAAAFAGARLLTHPAATGDDVWDAVATFAGANHIANPDTDVLAFFLGPDNTELAQITPGSDRTGATGLVVTTTINVRTFFINLVSGNSSSDVRTRARIQTGRLAGSPVAPVTVACQEAESNPLNPCGFQKDQPAILKGQTTAAGNLQWIAFLDTQPDGSCSYANNLAGFLSDPPNPTPPWVNTGDWVCGNTGSVNSSAIREKLKYWIDQNAIHERPWIVPIYDCIGHNGICDPITGMNVRYHIVSFGAFVLTGYDLNANPGGGCTGPAPMRYGDNCHFNEALPGAPPAGQVVRYPDNQTQWYPCQYWDPNVDNGINHSTGLPNPKGGWVFPNSCVQGKFVEYTSFGPVKASPCNDTGLDICGMELTE